jgi:hypothetical protein
MFQAANLRVELADKVRAIGMGGIGLVHRLAEETGLVAAIDRRLHLLKIHRSYHQSDHVLNLAYNAICEGIRLVGAVGRPTATVGQGILGQRDDVEDGGFDVGWPAFREWNLRLLALAGHQRDTSLGWPKRQVRPQ